MAAKATIVSRKSIGLTDNEKARKKAVAAIAAMLQRGDVSDWTTFVSEVTHADSVFRQQGDGNGKRYSGAKSHDFADQTTAYVDTYVRGNLPRTA